MKLVFVANWKMNHLAADARGFVEKFRALYKPSDRADVGIAPPYTTIPSLAAALNGVKGVMLGAQNVHWLDNGAHTGEISAPMLKELGTSFVIVGHSERRQFYGETDAGVAKRAKAALGNGLRAIVCVGETREQYEAKKTNEVVLGQLRGSLEGIKADETAKLIIAYEPVWAIGTGLAATKDDATRVHVVIRQELSKLFGPAGAQIAVLYGGSTTPDNIAQFTSTADIHGALVGGASLDAAKFNALIENGIKAQS